MQETNVKKPKRWETEEKLRIVKRYFDEKVGQRRLATEENISRGTLARWIENYRKGGTEALENKKPTMQRLPKHGHKNLSVEERQRLEILRLQIEIERLKKGYLVKGVGADKEFVTLKDLNSK